MKHLVRLFKLNLLCATSLIILYGCGGSGSGTTPPPDDKNIVTVTGGITPTTQIALSTVLSTTAEQQVLDAGSSVLGILPLKEQVLAGDFYCLVPKGVPLINNLKMEGRGQGSVWVNDNQTSIVLQNAANGTLGQAAVFNQSLAIPKNRTFNVRIQGPFVITTGSHTLQIANWISLGIETNASAIASAPLSIRGTLPGNGGTSATGEVLEVQVPLAYQGRMFRLTAIRENGQLTQDQRVADDGTLRFVDIVASNASIIPSAGLVELDFRILPR